MRGYAMNWDQTETNWDAFKNIIKYDWDQLTDAHLDVTAGRSDYLIRKIQMMYGLNKAEVETHLTEWQNNQINIDGHFYQVKPFSAVHATR